MDDLLELIAEFLFTWSRTGDEDKKNKLELRHKIGLFLFVLVTIAVIVFGIMQIT